MATISEAEARAEVLQAFLDRSSRRTERGIAYARLVLAGLNLAQLLWFGGTTRLAQGAAGHWLVLGVALLAIGWSTVVLLGLGSVRRLPRFLMASAAMDALIITLVLVAVVLWPTPPYFGLLRGPENTIFLVGLAGAGFRLSGRVAVVGAGLLLVAQIALIALDFSANAATVTYGAAHLAIWAVVFVGAMVLSISMAARGRRLVFDGARAAIEGERARQRFGLYVSEEVAREALGVADLRVGGRRQPAAVLFSDLRGFTRYAEHLPPEQLVSELNAYLDAMVRVIGAHGGMVDKFIGDAVMAVFGIPAPSLDDAARALRAALAMDEALAEHNAARRRAGRPPLAHGIGVHYGTVVAGNIGNADRLQYTVIGDAVNLASRLEAATKELGVSLVASEAAVAAARSAPDGASLPTLRNLGELSIRGRDSVVSVWTIEPPEPAARRA